MQIVFANQTGNSQVSDEKIYVVIIGLDAPAPDGRWSYLTKDGALVHCQLGDDTTRYAFTLADLKGQNYTIATIPPIISGRIYISYSNALKMPIKKDCQQPGCLGVAEPSVSDTSNPNYHSIFDKIELTLNPLPDGSLWCDTTQVDFFSIPLYIVVTGSQNGTQSSGQIAVSRTQIFTDFQDSTKSPKEFQNLIVRASDSSSLTQYVRVTAPNKAPASVNFPPDYFNPNITAFWAIYAATTGKQLTLAVGPVCNAKGDTCITLATGQVDGNVFTFTDNLENTYTIGYPSSENVFGCDGVFSIDGSLPTTPVDLQSVDGDIKKQVAAALNRSVEQYDSTTWCDTSLYYKQPITNHYSAIFHTDTLNGDCYGFAYDDVCSHSSTLEEKQPTELKIVLTAFE